MANATSGLCNIAIGVEAMKADATGQFNVAIGDQAGKSLTSADNNILLGRSSAPNAPEGDQNIVVYGKKVSMGGRSIIKKKRNRGG